MPLDPAFVADCPYGPGGLLLDEVLLVDAEKSLVRARMPTSSEMPLTREQRAHPVRHPRHFSGGLMIHMTGMVAFLHAYTILGLRHAEGWVGYGAKIYSARFHALSPPGEPMILECHGKLVRPGERMVFARYDFRFTQMIDGKETLVFEGDQSALWTKVPLSEVPAD